MTGPLVALSILFLAVTAGLIVLLVVTQRQHTQIIDRLVQAAEQDRTAHRAEVQDLLQRIQAPMLAATTHAEQATSAPVEPVYALTDEDAARAHDPEQAAREAQAVIDEMEAAANQFHNDFAPVS